MSDEKEEKTPDDKRSVRLGTLARWRTRNDLNRTYDWRTMYEKYDTASETSSTDGSPRMAVDGSTYADVIMARSFRLLNDLRKLRYDETPDEEVWTATMEACRKRYAGVLFVQPCITKCLTALRDDATNFLDTINAYEYETAFFVIGDANVWSLLVADKRTRRFYHYDTSGGLHYNVAFQLVYKLSGYFGTRKAYQPVCENVDGRESGYYAMHNMFRCMSIMARRDRGERITLNEPTKVEARIGDTKSFVVKCYVASVVDKIKSIAERIQ